MPKRDGVLVQGGIDCRYNVCSAHSSSFYTNDLDEVREVARKSGIRFANVGGVHSEYIDNPRGISGEMQTRYTDESLDLFDLFRDEDSFAGFIPVDYVDLYAVLEFIEHRKAERVAEANEENYA